MKFAIIAALAVALCHVSAKPTLSVELLSKLREQGHAGVMIVLRKDTSSVLESIGRRPFANSVEKTTAMVAELRRYTQENQLPIVNFLQQSRATYKQFWITNRIFVPQATLEVIEGLQKFDSEIAEVRLPHVAHVDATLHGVDSNPQANEW